MCHTGPPQDEMSLFFTNFVSKYFLKRKKKGKLLTGECKKDVGRQLRDRNMQQAIGRFLPPPPPDIL